MAQAQRVRRHHDVLEIIDIVGAGWPEREARVPDVLDLDDPSVDGALLDLVCSVNELVHGRREPVAAALHRLRAALEDDPGDATLRMRALLLESALATGQFR